MTELQRQNCPRRFRKLALAAGAPFAFILVGGITMAAGFDPIKLILTPNSDGTSQIRDENGSPVDLKWQVTPNGDGSFEASVTIPQPGTYSITITPPVGQKKAMK